MRWFSKSKSRFALGANYPEQKSFAWTQDCRVWESEGPSSCIATENYDRARQKNANCYKRMPKACNSNSEELQNNTTNFPEPSQRSGTKLEKHETKLRQGTWIARTMSEIYTRERRQKEAGDKKKKLSQYILIEKVVNGKKVHSDAKTTTNTTVLRRLELSKLDTKRTMIPLSTEQRQTPGKVPKEISLMSKTFEQGTEMPHNPTYLLKYLLLFYSEKKDFSSLERN